MIALPSRITNVLNAPAATPHQLAGLIIYPSNLSKMVLRETLWCRVQVQTGSYILIAT